MIIDNLRTSGVQNTIKKERLKFDRLEPFAGTRLHASGEYTEKGTSKRVHRQHWSRTRHRRSRTGQGSRLAGIGFDLLIVCGFAFDPHVSEEAKRYGKLTVLPAHMNPDLAMGDDLLKKTGAGNLFMVFGEPDLRSKRRTANSPSISRVWMYTTRPPARSAQTPPKTLPAGSSTPTTTRRPSSSATPTSPAPTNPTKSSSAPCAPRSKSAWAALYSTTSYPFEKPKTGKIAVKVINHYGDEVLKVYVVK